MKPEWHHGKMFGLPVYLDMSDPECPAVVGKHWIFDALLDNVMEPLFGMFCWTMTFFNPEWEPMYPLQVGPKVEDEEVKV